MGWPRQTFKKKPGTILRSGLEDRVAEQLRSLKVQFAYEDGRIPYTIETYYSPDFRLPNGIIIEAKGLFDTADRRKHKLIKVQHPELDIRFVFSNSTTKIGKGSKTSYGDWCNLNGFKYADKVVPEDWVKEKAKKKGK